jgi:Ca2+/Na+ antiporter
MNKVKTYKEYINEEQQYIFNNLLEESNKYTPEELNKLEEYIEDYILKFSEGGKTITDLDHEITEGLLGSILGGITGFALGNSIGKIVARILGVEKGILYDMLTSRLVGAALGSSLGKKI